MNNTKNVPDTPLKDAPLPYKVIAWPHRCAIVARELLFQTRTYMSDRRRRRDRKRVRNEYDEGRWRQILERQEWLEYDNLERFLTRPAGGAAECVAKVRGRLVRIRTIDYYRYKIRTIQDTLLKHAGDQTEITEIGCGTGWNIFTLTLCDHWKRLAGYDISENGVSTARLIARHFKLNHVEFGRLDLTSPDDPSFRRLRGQTVFTYYCLEQLKYHIHTVIENLLLAGVRSVVHIEPTPELLSPWSPMDWINALYIARNDYQDNLISTLREFERDKRLVITHTERLRYAPNPRHDPTLVCWRSTS